LTGFRAVLKLTGTAIRHVEIFPTIEALRSRYRANVPKVVIAAPASLAYGFSRRLLADFAEAQGNLIILTSEGEEGSLARQLFDVWNDRQKGDRKYGVGTVGEAEFIDQKMDLNVRIGCSASLPGILPE
jgi:cleavage and polyadenylation specificity factor subunit 2